MDKEDLLVKAHCCLLHQYNGSTMAAAAEMWAQEQLCMKKAARDTVGFDGCLPDGRKLQVKSKKAGAHRDSATYVTLSQATLKLADDLLIVFIDYETCKATRWIGPVPICQLVGRKGRYYVSRILKIRPPPPHGTV